MYVGEIVLLFSAFFFPPLIRSLPLPSSKFTRPNQLFGDEGQAGNADEEEEDEDDEGGEEAEDDQTIQFNSQSYLRGFADYRVVNVYCEVNIFSFALLPGAIWVF